MPFGVPRGLLLGGLLVGGLLGLSWPVWEPSWDEKTRAAMRRSPGEPRQNPTDLDISSLGLVGGYPGEMADAARLRHNICGHAHSVPRGAVADLLSGPPRSAASNSLALICATGDASRTPQEHFYK